MSTYETMRSAHAEHSHNRAAKMAKRAQGGKVEGSEPKQRMDRARGGKVEKGRHHAKVSVNVIVPQAGGAPGGMPMPHPPMAGVGAAPGGPPMPPRPMAPPGAMPPGGPPGAAPMMRPPGMKRGGTVGQRFSQSGDPPKPVMPPKMKAGAMSGEGRLEKAAVGVKGLK